MAFFAHASGFIAGMVLIPFFKHSHVPLFHLRPAVTETDERCF